MINPLKHKCFSILAGRRNEKNLRRMNWGIQFGLLLIFLSFINVFEFKKWDNQIETTGQVLSAEKQKSICHYYDYDSEYGYDYQCEVWLLNFKVKDKNFQQTYHEVTTDDFHLINLPVICNPDYQECVIHEDQHLSKVILFFGVF